MTSDGRISTIGEETRQPARAFLGLLLIAILSLIPLLLESRTVSLVRPYANDALQSGAKALVLGLMFLAIVVVERNHRRALLLALLAGLMTWMHMSWIDLWNIRVGESKNVLAWQKDMYLRVLNSAAFDQGGGSMAPHRYRPLPYGFTRTLERITGDWFFACQAYRWFFSFWFLWACHRFVAIFHGPRRAWIGVAAVVLLYPLSLLYYLGQLTDPLSHALFVLGMIFIVTNRWLAFAGALFLGMMAKETAVVLVPAYWLCCGLRDVGTLKRTMILGLVAVAGFLLVRIPLGWTPGLSALNGTSMLMIGPNLGFDMGPYLSPSPHYQHFLQPFLFIGIFLLPIIWGWRRIDRKLQALVLVLVPLILLTSLCFSWLHESRNYIPLLPLLVAAACSAFQDRTKTA